jgi:hypothetical protein
MLKKLITPLVSGLVLFACAEAPAIPEPVAVETPKQRYVIHWKTDDAEYGIQAIRDEQTGCEYIVVWGNAITPRLSKFHEPLCGGE